MKLVEPIRDMQKVKAFKSALLEKGSRDYIMGLIGLNTGLRISDILDLKVGQVKNKKETVITEEKTGKKRKIYWDSIYEEIQNYVENKNENDYLIASRQGGPLERTQAWRIIRAAGKKCNLLDLGTHSLRKTFGYHYYKKTHDVAMLMQIFNHSSPTITLRYIGINDEEIQNSLKGFSL